MDSGTDDELDADSDAYSDVSDSFLLPEDELPQQSSDEEDGAQRVHHNSLGEMGSSDGGSDQASCSSIHSSSDESGSVDSDSMDSDSSCCAFDSDTEGNDSEESETSECVIRRYSDMSDMSDSDDDEKVFHEAAVRRIVAKALKPDGLIFRKFKYDEQCSEELVGLDPTMEWSTSCIRPHRRSHWRKRKRCGIVNFHKHTPPHEMFATLINDSITIWMENTNRKAAEMAAQQGRSWKPMDQYDVYAYLAITIWMDTTVRPELRDYWKVDDLIGDTLVKSVSELSGMSHRRYATATHCTRLYDKQKATDNGWNDPKSENYEPTHQVKPYIDAMCISAQREVTPPRNLSVDEAVDKFTGRFSSRQYIPRKPNNTGVKTYNVCASKHPYLFATIVHHSASTYPFHRIGHKFGLTWALLTGSTIPGGIGFLDKFHCLYFDSYYTSVHLFWELIHRNTFGVGTVEPGLVCLPEDLCKPESRILKNKQINRGNAVFRHTDDGVLSFVAWLDKALVRVLYTDPLCVEEMGQCRRGDKSVAGGISVFSRPSIIEEYNRRMGGVDLSDQLNAAQYRHRRSSYWYHVLFNRVIRVLVSNTYALMGMMGNPTSVLNLKRQIAERLASFAIRPHPTAPLSLKHHLEQKVKNRYNIESALHHPEFVPNGQRRVCQEHIKRRQRKLTPMKCANCDSFLCKNDPLCWINWHSM